MRDRFSFLLALALGVFIAGSARAQSSPAPAAGPSPIASADGEAPGLQVQVKKLKREGDSVMLQLVLMNSSDTAYDLGNLNSSQYRSVDGVYLVDMAGKKKYEVVRDTDKSCVCSHDLQQVAPKSSVNVWAKFPAPPDSVQKVGVVVPHFMPLDDVPLSQ